MKKMRCGIFEIIAITEKGKNLLDEAQKLEEKEQDTLITEGIKSNDLDMREYFGETEEEINKNFIERLTNPFNI